MKTILLYLLFICAALPAFEFESIPLLQKNLTWHCDNPVLSDSFLRMFAQWNNVLDQRFTIEKVDGDADLTVQYKDLSSCGFAGYSTWSVDGDALFDINIVVDPLQANFVDNIMLHEIGHVLGMAHSADAYAIMYPMVGFILPVLGNDDIIGICIRYGVSLPSTVAVGIQFKRLGKLKYKFKLSGFDSQAPHWSFSDGTTNANVVVVHKFAKKGMTTITVRLGAYVDTISIPIR